MANGRAPDSALPFAIHHSISLISTSTAVASAPAVPATIPVAVVVGMAAAIGEKGGATARPGIRDSATSSSIGGPAQQNQ